MDIMDIYQPTLESHIQNNVHIKHLRAENSRLHSLIEKAFKEAYVDGYAAGITNGKPNSEESFKQFKEVHVKKKR